MIYLGYQNPYGGSNPYQAPPGKYNQLTKNSLIVKLILGNAGYQNPYAPQQGMYILL